jgi:hypothetical protein
MAAEAIDLFDEKAELLKKINARLRTIQTATGELTEFVGALNEKQAKTSSLDENGEPRFLYLVRRPIPEDFRLTKKMITYAAEYGFNEESARILCEGKGTYEGFRKHYQRTGAKWINWSLVFMKWVRSEHERKAQKQAGGGSATRFSQSRTRV